MREIKVKAFYRELGLSKPCKLYPKAMNFTFDNCRSYYALENLPHGTEFLMFTGLKDKNGVEIYEGDRLRFYPSEASKASNDGCIWDGTVIFADGVFTVDIQTCSQVANPNGWEKEHNWINSRWWSTKVGYGEYGTWNCPRKDLVSIDNGFGSTSECFDRLYAPLAKKIGYGSRFLNAEVIGNIYENPELLDEN